MIYRLNNRKLLYLMPVAGLIAAAINAVLFLIGSATEAIPGNLLLPNIRRPLEIGPVIGSSFIPPIVAGILLALLNRFTKKPLLIFNVIAVAFLLLSFVTPFSIPKAPVGMIMLLELMHVVVAGMVLLLANRYATLTA